MLSAFLRTLTFFPPEKFHVIVSSARVSLVLFQTDCM